MKKELAGGRAVERSDSWSDEDLADATAAAVRRFEDKERSVSMSADAADTSVRATTEGAEIA
jgi:hypothetical protein